MISYPHTTGCLRRKSSVDAREAQYAVEQELKVLDQLENRTAPTKETSTNQLDNRPKLDLLR